MEKEIVVDHVGLDVGFGQTKCVFDGGAGKTSTVIFPSVAGRPDKKALDHIQGHGPDGFSISLAGTEFFVGKDSSLFGAVRGSQGFREDYSETLEYKAFHLGALCYVAKAHGSNRIRIQSLCIGLPLQTWSSHHTALRAMAQGEHTIEASGTAFQVNVKEVHVIAQPQGTLFAQSLHGQAILGNQTSLVVDMGGGTTDWFTASGYRPIPDRCGSHTVGTLECAEAIAEAVKRGYGKKKQVLARIDAALALGHRTALIDGVERPLPLQATTQRLNEVLSEVQHGVRDLADIDRIVLTGGGAKLLEPVLRQRFPHRRLTIDPDPVMANARGFHRVALLIPEARRGGNQ